MKKELTQRERVLAAFKAASGHTLTTMQIDAIPFMTNQRARISDLRAKGHAFKVERIKGKNQSKFVWLGQNDILAHEPLAREWVNIGNGFEAVI